VFLEEALDIGSEPDDLEKGERLIFFGAHLLELERMCYVDREEGERPGGRCGFIPRSYTPVLDEEKEEVETCEADDVSLNAASSAAQLPSRLRAMFQSHSCWLTTTKARRHSLAQNRS
jgi:hypothetical protein